LTSFELIFCDQHKGNDDGWFISKAHLCLIRFNFESDEAEVVFADESYIII